MVAMPNESLAAFWLLLYNSFARLVASYAYSTPLFGALVWTAHSMAFWLPFAESARGAWNAISKPGILPA